MLQRLIPAALFCALASSAWAGDTYIEGVASHYGIGDGYHGKRTACGQLMNAYGMTAAHRTLPCGTVLQVYLVDRNGHRKGKPVIVTVTDRGPFSGNRVLDLSYGAARVLGFVEAGTARIVGRVLAN